MCIWLLSRLLSSNTGANPNDKENKGRSPIIWASIEGGHVNVVELLLSKRADIPNIDKIIFTS